MGRNGNAAAARMPIQQLEAALLKDDEMTMDDNVGNGRQTRYHTLKNRDYI